MACAVELKKQKSEEVGPGGERLLDALPILVRAWGDASRGCST